MPVDFDPETGEFIEANVPTPDYAARYGEERAYIDCLRAGPVWYCGRCRVRAVQRIRVQGVDHDGQTKCTSKAWHHPADRWAAYREAGQVAAHDR